MSDSISNRYIKTSAMLRLMQRTDSKGRAVPFDIMFVRRSDGAVDEWKGCWLTSRYSLGGTVNIMPPGRNAPKKVRICLILKFNNLIVYN